MYVSAEQLQDEGEGVMWKRILGAPTAQADALRAKRVVFSDTRPYYKEYPEDVRYGRMDIEKLRKYTMGADNASFFFTADQWVTYHSIEYSVAGNIIDAPSETDQVDIYLHRADDGEVVITASRIGNGSYEFTWHNKNELLYVTAVQNGVNCGRSSNGYAE